jgi:hypothetical protein
MQGKVEVKLYLIQRKLYEQMVARRISTFAAPERLLRKVNGIGFMLVTLHRATYVCSVQHAVAAVCSSSSVGSTVCALTKHCALYTH